MGPSVSLSFLLRSPIALFRELVSLMRPTSTLDSTGPNASIFTLRRPQLLLESAAMNPAGTGGMGVAPRATTSSTTVVSPASVPSPTTVLNPASPNLLPSSITNNSVPTNPLTPPIGTVPDLQPTITAPSAPSTPSVAVPDTPSVPSVTGPNVPSTPSVRCLALPRRLAYRYPMPQRRAPHL